jgi:hypothetical protein
MNQIIISVAQDLWQQVTKAPVVRSESCIVHLALEVELSINAVNVNGSAIPVERVVH